MRPTPSFGKLVEPSCAGALALDRRTEVAARAVPLNGAGEPVSEVDAGPESEQSLGLRRVGDAVPNVLVIAGHALVRDEVRTQWRRRRSDHLLAALRELEDRQCLDAPEVDHLATRLRSVECADD